MAVTTRINRDSLVQAAKSHGMRHVVSIECLYEPANDTRIVQWITEKGNHGAIPMDGSMEQFTAMLVAMKLTD